MHKALISFADVVLDKKVGQSPLFIKLYKMNLRELSLFLKQEILSNPLLDMSQVGNYDYAQQQADLVWDGKKCRANEVFFPQLRLKPEYLECEGDFFVEQRKRVRFLQNILSSRQNLLQKVGGYLCSFQWRSWEQKAAFSPLSVGRLSDDLQISKNICYALLKGKQVDFGGQAKRLVDFLVKGKGATTLEKVKKRVRSLAQEGKNDRQIAQALEAEGWQISRRTVCKYRHQLS